MLATSSGLEHGMGGSWFNVGVCGLIHSGHYIMAICVYMHILFLSRHAQLVFSSVILQMEYLQLTTA